MGQTTITQTTDLGLYWPYTRGKVYAELKTLESKLGKPQMKTDGGNYGTKQQNKTV